ncbi:MAG: enoyl-CoA hydratase [Monoraphidium minutum]|nr:MAG: enoyl-CoA hydratase [Monoraphidium minutum]
MAAPLITVEAVPPQACGQDAGGVTGDGDSGVRLLRLNNTKGALNSLTLEMAEAFKEVAAKLEADKGMRALVITGEGRAFSAGGDFGFIEDRIAGDVEDNHRVLAGFYTTFLSLQKLPVPAIAALNGPAVGGGMGLAMAADMRIASTAAKLSFNFVKLGLTPGMASACVLPAATSHQVACRLLLTGDLIGAQEALDLGLVLQVVEPEELLPAAQQLAGRIAAASPSAVGATLRLLRDRLPWEELEAAARQEARLQASFFKAPDCREGVDSVRGKRPARFGPAERAP